MADYPCEITKDFAFVGGHALDGLPETHPCTRVHGHNYIVRVQLATGFGMLDETGFVYDYGALVWFGRLLDDEYDHQWLGAGPVYRSPTFAQRPVVDFNPTAELLASHFQHIIGARPDIRARRLAVLVGVSETPKTWAWSR